MTASWKKCNRNTEATEPHGVHGVFYTLREPLFASCLRGEKTPSKRRGTGGFAEVKEEVSSILQLRP